jgi:hypothetical protein
VYTYSGDVTMQFGPHTVKYGGNVLRIQKFDGFPYVGEAGTFTCLLISHPRIKGQRMEADDVARWLSDLAMYQQLSQKKNRGGPDKGCIFGVVSI